MWLIVAAALAADIDPLMPSGAFAGGQGTPWLEDATLGEPGVSIDLSVGYLHAPLVIRNDRGERLGAREFVPLTLHTGWTFRNDARLDLHLPVYAWADVELNSYRSPALGDLELSAVVPIWQHSPMLVLAAQPVLGLPTGSDRALVRRGIHGGASLLISGEHPIGFGYTSQLGLTGSGAEPVGDRTLGSTVDLGAGVWWRFSDHLRVGGDLVGAAGIAGGSRANHHLSGHLFAQVILPHGLGLLLSGGSGFTPGIGAPRARVLCALSWSPTQRDRDRDGLDDDRDSCPDEAEDPDGFEDDDGCPELDNDGDRLLDADDACPLDPEDEDDFEDDDGCPEPDNDGDTLPDQADLCPNHAGPAEAYGCPDTDGDHMIDPEDLCPAEPGPTNTYGCPDADGDRVPDHSDACIDEPTLDPDADPDGCPSTTASLADDRIELSGKIEFETGSATVTESSGILLDDIASILTEHPELLRVEIAGHTDAEGDHDANVRLSKNRANAVRDALIDRGIAPDRLVAEGYGPDQPIDTNRTQRGRAANRRVELVVIERE